MDTKKVADDLVEKYINLIEDVGTDSYQDRKTAKQCAILCVEEIMEAHHSCEDCEEEGSIELRDWRKVKEHLNNM